MSNILVYNKLNGDILQYLKSVHTPDYTDRDDVLINPELPSNDISTLKVVSKKVVILSAEELQVKADAKLALQRKHLRTRELPKEQEQLDAILKQFQDLKDRNRMTLIPELQTLVDEWQATNDKYR